MIKIGDHIFVNNKSEKVISIEKIKNKGAYAPITFDGNLIVDNTLVSSYATYTGSHDTVIPFFGKIVSGNMSVHIGMSPIRLINRFYSCLNNTSYNKSENFGYHDFVCFSIRNKNILLNSKGEFPLSHPIVLIWCTFCGFIYIIDLFVSFIMKKFGIETLF